MNVIDISIHDEAPHSVKLRSLTEWTFIPGSPQTGFGVSIKMSLEFSVLKVAYIRAYRAYSYYMPLHLLRQYKNSFKAMTSREIFDTVTFVCMGICGYSCKYFVSYVLSYNVTYLYSI